MKEECVHQVETLVHGLEALAKVKGGLLPGEPPIPGDPPVDLGFIAGIMNTFRDHEAREVELFDRANTVLTDAALSDPPQLLVMVQGLQEEFLSRAVAALMDCECGKGG